MIFLSRIKSLVEGLEPREPRITVFGDSHSVALQRAQQYTKRSHEYDHIDVRRLRKDKEGKAVGDTSLAEFCRQIGEFDDRDFVFSAVGGNQYAIVSTVQPEVDYDFLEASSDELTSGAQLVPFRAVAGFIESERRAHRVFWRDANDLKVQLATWRGAALDRLVRRLTETHRALLSNSQAAEILLAQELAEIARKSMSQRRGR